MPGQHPAGVAPVAPWPRASPAGCAGVADRGPVGLHPGHLAGGADGRGQHPGEQPGPAVQVQRGVAGLRRSAASTAATRVSASAGCTCQNPPALTRQVRPAGPSGSGPGGRGTRPARPRRGPSTASAPISPLARGRPGHRLAHVTAAPGAAGPGRGLDRPRPGPAPPGHAQVPDPRVGDQAVSIGTTWWERCRRSPAVPVGRHRERDPGPPAEPGSGSPGRSPGSGLRRLDRPVRSRPIRRNCWADHGRLELAAGRAGWRAASRSHRSRPGARAGRAARPGPATGSGSRPHPPREPSRSPR